MRTVCVDGSGNDTLTLDGIEEDLQDAEVIMNLNKTETLGVNKTFDAVEVETCGDEYKHDESTGGASQNLQEPQIFQSPASPKSEACESPITPHQEIQSPESQGDTNTSLMAQRVESEPVSSPAKENNNTSLLVQGVEIEPASSPTKEDFQKDLPVMEISYRNLDERVATPAKHKAMEKSYRNLDERVSPVTPPATEKIDEIPIEQTETSFSVRNATFNESLSESASPCKLQQQQPEPQRQQTPSPSVAKSPAVEKSPSSLQKLSENFFMDTMESRLDVEFKMPAAPVLKQQPSDEFKDEDFKTCGSSCKNK
jgi:hypothetical protein